MRHRLPDKSGVPISAPFVFGGSVEMRTVQAPEKLDARKSKSSRRRYSLLRQVLDRGSLLPLFVALAVLLDITGCSKSAPTEPPAAPAKEPETPVKRGANGNLTLTLSPESQQAAGIRAEPIASVAVKPELKTFGRVLDPSTLGPLVADLAGAEATARASAAELKRLQTLSAQNNASARSLEAAQATAARDKALLEAARLRLVSGWGSELSSETNLAELVTTLAEQKAALLQLNLEVDQRLPDSSRSARVSSLSSETNSIEAQLLGPAPAVDPQMQGRALLLIARENPIQLTPGMAITGYFEQSGPPQTGVNLPDASVVHHNGTTWIYVQTAENTFERRRVLPERPLPGGWFVSSGVRPDEKVVMAGAQVLLSEELKGQESAPD